MSKVEVSAIITDDSLFGALAITPCASKVFIFLRSCNCWIDSEDGFPLWQSSLSLEGDEMRVYRGIFTIEVPSPCVALMDCD